MIQYNTVWDSIYRTAVYQCCTLVSDCIGAHVRCPEAVSSDVWCEQLSTVSTVLVLMKHLSVLCHHMSSPGNKLFCVDGNHLHDAKCVSMF